MDEGLARELLSAEIAAEIALLSDLVDGLVGVVMEAEAQSLPRERRVAVLLSAILQKVHSANFPGLAVVAIEQMAQMRLDQQAGVRRG